MPDSLLGPLPVARDCLLECFPVCVFNKIWLSAETFLFQLFYPKESIPATLDITLASLASFT